jgi:uncharacterized Fe-S cluster protein YjdI
MAQKTKEYSNDDITVIWKPDLCIHSAECVKGSPEVFNPEEHPWIRVDKSGSEQIMATIDKCPSGALSYRTKKPAEAENLTGNETVKMNKVSIKATKNGPFLVKGLVEVEDSSGEVRISEGNTTALCRCGASSNKPFCDGSHTAAKFEG